MKKMLFSIAIVSVVTLPAMSVKAEHPASGQVAERASVEALVNAIRANRKALVAANLRLTDDEAGKFWPVYDRYQAAIAKIGDRFVAVIEDYSASFPELSDEKATRLVNDYMDVEADRVAVRRSYVQEFLGALPGRKVARLYQIENKMDALIRYDLAATIPVVEQDAAAPAK